MKLKVFNPPKGGWASSPQAATNQANALRRIRKPGKEKPDDGLRRFLGVDPAISETLERAGL